MYRFSLQRISINHFSGPNTEPCSIHCGLKVRTGFFSLRETPVFGDSSPPAQRTISRSNNSNAQTSPESTDLTISSCTATTAVSVEWRALQEDWQYLTAGNSICDSIWTVSLAATARSISIRSTWYKPVWVEVVSIEPRFLKTWSNNCLFQNIRKQAFLEGTVAVAGVLASREMRASRAMWGQGPAHSA